MLSDNLDAAQGTAYMVLIEWDGAKPPSKFYRHLEKLAFTVRANTDTNLGPLTRRASSKGVIFQEGCFLCDSEYLANLVFQYAGEAIKHLERTEQLWKTTTDGSLVKAKPTISLGPASLTSTPHMTAEDEAIFQRITNTLGKKGRKPDPEWFVIACRECLETREVKTSHPLNCTACGSPAIRARKGKIDKFSHTRTDIIEMWLDSRFATGQWEIADCEEKSAIPISPPAPVQSVGNITNDKERDTVLDIFANKKIMDVVNKKRPYQAMMLLDACLMSLTYRTKAERVKHRIQALTTYISLTGTSPTSDLAEPDPPDIWVAAGPIDASMLASMLI